MNKLNSIETHSNLNLSDQTKLILNEIKKIKNYFISDIQEREIISKKLSKTIASLDYMDKVLIVLSATCGGVSIIFHASVIEIPAGMICSRFTLVFCLTTAIIKKLLKETRKKKKNIVKLLCWPRVN